MSSGSTGDEDDEKRDNEQCLHQLHTLFKNRDTIGEGRLGKAGLVELCDDLNLSQISDVFLVRILNGSKDVDFETFKERFINLIPELPSPSADSFEQSLIKTARDLKLATNGFLNRYETNLLCQHVAEFAQLYASDIEAIFESADPLRTGRISISMLISSFERYKSSPSPARTRHDQFFSMQHSTSSSSSLNLLEPLGTATFAGAVNARDLLEYWSQQGLNLDNGIRALQMLGQSVHGLINVVALNRNLEQELYCVSENSMASKAAMVTLYALIDHLRWAVGDLGKQAEFAKKQLNAANQRRDLLIEEFEHNQAVTEQTCEARIRETEDRHRIRLRTLEERHSSEKRELQAELEVCEAELGRVRQSEMAARGRCQFLERQANRATTDAIQTSIHLEQLNRPLRLETSKSDSLLPINTEIQRKSSTGGGGGGGQLAWKDRLDLLAAHKRLRDKMSEVSSSVRPSPPRKTTTSMKATPISSHWTPAFRSHLLLLRRRRQARGDTLSEMDSESESIFVRAKRRRLLKFSERRHRFTRIAEFRAPNGHSTGKGDEATSSAAIREHVMQRALDEQKHRLTEQFESERRQLQARIGAERADWERRSAIQKMAIVQQLQTEYDDELKRIASHSTCVGEEEYKKQIKLLESSLEGQRNGYESKMAELRGEHERELISQRRRLVSLSALARAPTDNSCTDFINLLDRHRGFTDGQNLLGNKASDVAVAVADKKTCCSKCETIEKRLMELHHLITGDVTMGESGIEDLGSGPDSHHEEAAQLRLENARLKKRLEMSRDMVADLRLSLSVVIPTVSNSHLPSSTQPDGNRLLLQARLEQSQSLVRQLAGQYQGQLVETSRIGRLLQKIMSSLHY